MSAYFHRLVCVTFTSTLVLIVLCNIFITMWIMRFTGIGSKGLMSLILTSDTVGVRDNLYSEKSIFTNQIDSNSGQDLELHSFSKIMLKLESNKQHTTSLSSFEIGPSGVALETDQFSITAKNGQPYLIASSGHDKETSTEFRSRNIHLQTTSDMTSVSGSLVTPKLNAGPGQSLEIAAYSGKIEAFSPKSIDVKSLAGSININAWKSIRLKTKTDGEILLQSGSVKISSLVNRSILRQEDDDYNVHTQSRLLSVGQLCACINGRLFVSHDKNGQCLADYHICPYPSE